MKKIFLTFSTSDWTGTRTRLYFRALESGWFDEVLTKDEKIVPEQYSDRLNDPFHGFYFWKPLAIYDVLKNLSDGDILVYADAGSDINLGGWKYFNEKTELLNDHDILVYGLTYLRQFCSPLILADFGISLEEAQNIKAAQAGLIYIKKSQHSMKIIGEWKDYLLNDYSKIAYDFNAKGDIDGFVQNRADQSVFGCLCEKYKKNVCMLEPNNDWAVVPRNMSGIELRASECDILLTRKKFNYKPYVMFVVGQELPFFEKQYDEYTHFLNIGNRQLHRLSDARGDSIHHLKGLAEQTGLYWIWKNVDLSSVKYIGFSTHRKPFFSSNEELFKAMENGSSVVANLYFQKRKETVLTSFDESMFDDFVDTFAKYHPQDKAAFLEHETCGRFFPSNSFVMRVSDFYNLCEYIFPVMLEFALKHEGEEGLSTDRVSHAPPAGVFGEDIVSFYIMSRLCQQPFFSPFVIYPKGEELFRAETSNFGMIFGTKDQLFFPYGRHPRCPAVIRTSNQYVSDDSFYPSYSSKSVLPNIIKTKAFKIG